MQLRAFLSSSFNPEDKPVVERLKAILQGIGIDCYQAENVPRIPDSIISSILSHKLFIAVLTPEASGQVPPAVTLEVGAALSHKKQVVMLRDDSVPVQSFYSDRFQKPFNRARLLNDDAEEISSIKAAIAELVGWYGYELGEPDAELDRRYSFAKSQTQFLGSAILGYFNEVLYHNDVRDRAVRNFPTQADRRASNMIVNAIQQDSVTTEDGIVSEEAVEDLRGLKDTIERSEFVWIIDPLDGTLNFAYAFPFFCVSLGLLREGRPVLGIIYNPVTQELYCGRKGHVSECVDLRSGVKRTLELNSGKKHLEDCVVMTHLSVSNRDARNRTISILHQLIENTRGVRMLGSGQRALVSLALGQFDMFFNYHTHIWDIVPGYVILKNAGGYATSCLETGDTWSWESRGILAASNHEIGEKLRHFLHGRLRTDFPTY